MIGVQELTHKKRMVLGVLVIDFAHSSGKMLNNFVKINIDENKDIYELSDHCLEKLEFKTNKEKISKTKDKIKFYSVKEERKEAYVQMVENEIRKLDTEINIDKLGTILYKCADKVLN